MTMISLPSLNANYNIQAHLTDAGIIDHYKVSPNSFAVQNTNPWQINHAQASGIKEEDLKVTNSSSNTLTPGALWDTGEMISKIGTIYAKYHAEPTLSGNNCTNLIFSARKKGIPLLPEEEAENLTGLIEQTKKILNRLPKGELEQRFSQSFSIQVDGDQEESQHLQGNAQTKKNFYGETTGSALSEALSANEKTQKLDELFSLTEELNQKAKQKKDYGFMLSSAASIVSLVSFILTLDTPECSDEAFTSHMQTTQILCGITSFLAGAAGSASLRNRSITLPNKALFASEFNADSQFDEKEKIKYQKAVKQNRSQLPPFLLPKSAQIIRENMQFLGEYKARQAFLMRRPSNHHPDPKVKANLSQRKLIDLEREAHAYLTTAKIASFASASFLGMLTLFASAGTEGAIALTTQQSRLCNASTSADPHHDERIDVTNLAIIPFGLTLIGTALLLTNKCFRSQDLWDFQKEIEDTNKNSKEKEPSGHEPANILSGLQSPRSPLSSDRRAMPQARSSSAVSREHY